MPRCVARVATFEFQRGKQDVAVRFVYFAGAPDKIQVVVDGHVVRQHDNAKGNRKPCITHARELVEYYFEGRPQRRKATGPRLKVVGGEQ